MAQHFGSPGWAAALVEEIEGSSEYRNAAANWGVGFVGDVTLVFEADAALAETVRLWVRLAEGRCRGAEFLGPEAPLPAGFVLRAPFSLWKQILERKTTAAVAILTGRMTVVGDRLLLLRHTAAHRALVHCASQVETLW